MRNNRSVLGDGVALAMARDAGPAWICSGTELHNLLDPMGEAHGALDDGGIPESVFVSPPGRATPEQIRNTLAALARQPPEPAYLPDDWVDWLRWLARAAEAGGFSSAAK